MLGELWSSVKGFRFCSGIWAYFTARDRNRTERELNKQHDEGTLSIAQELQNGGVVWETQPGRSRFIYRPSPATAESSAAELRSIPAEILDVRVIAESLAAGQLENSERREQEST